jgi:hypothetical protein
MSSPSRRFHAVLLVLTGFLSPAFAEAESPEPRWGLPEELLAGLAEQADAYLERSYRFTCVETSRHVRYRPERPILRERRYEYAPGGSYQGNKIPEFRLQMTPEGRVGKPVRRKSAPFPTADDWTQLFSARHQPLFMYRQLGVRLEGLDLVREIEFRGWLPFTDGRDIREWEGTALVESTRLRVVEIRARPRNQVARIAFLYDRWARSWKISLGLFAGPLFFPIKTFRTAPKPLAHHCHVRFDHWQEEIRLPTLLRYETHQAVSPQRTERRRVSTRLYSGYSRLS